jgi:hypothetical protein
MAHFAELDENNIVKQVIVVDNNELLDENNNESEQKGIDFCKSLYGENTKWIQTSYNGNFRKNLACVNCPYDPIADIFILPQPYPSWVLNENSDWVAPVEKPEGLYRWDEPTLSWVEVALPE